MHCAVIIAGGKYITSCFFSVAAAPAAPAADMSVAVPADTPVNKKTYHARLGLARALSRTPDTIEDSKKYYHEVIDMAPEVRDFFLYSKAINKRNKPDKTKFGA